MKKEEEIRSLKEKDTVKEDVIANMSNQLVTIATKLQELEKNIFFKINKLFKAIILL